MLKIYSMAILMFLLDIAICGILLQKIGIRLVVKAFEKTFFAAGLTSLICIFLLILKEKISHTISFPEIFDTVLAISLFTCFIWLSLCSMSVKNARRILGSNVKSAIYHDNISEMWSISEDINFDDIGKTVEDHPNIISDDKIKTVELPVFWGGLLLLKRVK
jgi:hypothetical protein